MSTPLTAATASTPSAALLRAEEAVLEMTGIPVARHEVSVSGVRLHYLTCGAGEPLVLLHGRGGAGAVFAPIFAQLAASHQLFALDLPGWGLSEKPPFSGRSATDTLHLWMGAVIGFLDALGLERVDLLGHSMGGFTALGVALEHPERVRRLALVDAGGLGVDVQLDTRLYFWLKPERLNAWLGRRFFASTLRHEHPKRPLRDGPLFDFLYAVMAQPEVVLSGAEAFNKWINLSGVHLDFRGRLRELQMPVLLMWGDRDTLTRYSDALKAARRIPYARLVAFTGCGHMPFLERPEDFARVLRMWLGGDAVASRV